MSGSYDAFPDELKASLEEMFRAGPPLTELQQIGRGPTIDGLAERLRRGEVRSSTNLAASGRRRWPEVRCAGSAPTVESMPR